MTLKPTKNSTGKPTNQKTQQPGASSQVGAKGNNETAKSQGSGDHKVTDQEAKTGKNSNIQADQNSKAGSSKQGPSGSSQHK